MKIILQIFILVLGLTSTRAIVPGKDPMQPSPNCEQFSLGVQLNDSEVLGVWHLLFYKTERSQGSDERYCVKFDDVTSTERTYVQDRISKYAGAPIFENLTLKMKFPCNEEQLNKTREFYLERMGSNGFYKTLQIPTLTANNDVKQLHRYPMRLKIMEGGYLGIMDCYEKYIFMMGRSSLDGKPVDETLKKMIELYWPQED